MTEDEIRAELRTALSGLGAGPGAAADSRMGAGSDDVEGPREYLRSLAPGGWVVPSWPAEFGGRGASPAAAAQIRVSLAEFPGRDLYPFMVGLYLVGPSLLVHGSQDQKNRWLRPIVDGSAIWCQMFSEPSAGSDLANVATRARRDASGWRLTGQKVWTSRAGYATWGMCLARTDPEVPKHQGLTMFAVKMDAPGVIVRPLRQMNGDHHFSEVFLEDAGVSDVDRMPGDGRSAGPGGTQAGPPAWLAELAATGALADDVLRDRAMRVYVSECVADLTQARAAANAEAGRAPGPEGSGQKLRAGAVFRQRAELIKDAGGLAGLLSTTSGHIEFLTAPSMSIRGGTDEIQRTIIGERILGLEREPNLDQDKPWSQTRSGS